MGIGERIRNARKAAGLTQVDVAKEAGIAVNSLRLYEAGKRQPNLVQLAQIADALTVDLLDLLGYGTQKEFETKMIQVVSRYHKILSTLLHSESIPEAWKVFIRDNQPNEQETKNTLRALAVHRIKLSRYTGLMDAFDKLNPDGQQKAVERVEELTEIPKYQNTETPTESPEYPTAER